MKYSIGQTIDQFTITAKTKHLGRTAYDGICSCGKQTKKTSGQLSKKHCRCVDCGNLASGNKRQGTHHQEMYSSEYRAWSNMKNRCSNPKYELFHRYGGRGISVCEKWVNDFEVFLKDMGKKPSIDHSLDRINNNKGYSKDNCRWATKTEQANNTNSNIIFAINGIENTLSDWCRIKNLKYATISKRIREGMSGEEAVNQGSKNLQDRYIYIVDGIKYNTLATLAKELDVPKTTAGRRFDSINFQNWTKQKL